MPDKNSFDWPRTLVIIATLLIFGLSIWRANLLLLSVDELYEVTLVAQPYSDLLADYRVSSQLVHVTLVKLLSAICWDILCFRLASIIAGTLCVPLLYRVARILFDAQTAAISALMLSITGVHLEYTAYLRGYSLMVMLSLLSIYGFIQATKSGELRWWLVFVVASVINIYNQVFAIFLVAPLFTFLLIGAWQRNFALLKKQGLKAAASGLTALLLLAPMVFLLLNNQSHTDNLAVLTTTDWPNGFPPFHLSQPFRAFEPLVRMSYEFSPADFPAGTRLCLLLCPLLASFLVSSTRSTVGRPLY